MKTTTETRIFELFRPKFTEEDSKELVSEFKSTPQHDLAERIESKIIATLTGRLLFFFIAQVGFTIILVKLMG